MGSRSQASRGRVLVVEDNDEGREMLASFLEYEGYQVSQAPHGQAALELLKVELAPDVIITDLRMPVLDGWSLCEELAKSEALRRVPVIVLTAAPEENPPRGVTRVIPKPVDLDDLTHWLTVAFEGVERSIRGV